MSRTYHAPITLTKKADRSARVRRHTSVARVNLREARKEVSA